MKEEGFTEDELFDDPQLEHVSQKAARLAKKQRQARKVQALKRNLAEIDRNLQEDMTAKKSARRSNTKTIIHSPNAKPPEQGGKSGFKVGGKAGSKEMAAIQAKFMQNMQAVLDGKLKINAASVARSTSKVNDMAESVAKSSVRRENEMLKRFRAQTKALTSAIRSGGEKVGNISRSTRAGVEVGVAGFEVLREELSSRLGIFSKKVGEQVGDSLEDALDDKSFQRDMKDEVEKGFKKKGGRFSSFLAGLFGGKASGSSTAYERALQRNALKGLSVGGAAKKEEKGIVDQVIDKAKGVAGGVTAGGVALAAGGVAAAGGAYAYRDEIAAGAKGALKKVQELIGKGESRQGGYDALNGYKGKATTVQKQTGTRATDMTFGQAHAFAKKTAASDGKGNGFNNSSGAIGRYQIIPSTLAQIMNDPRSGITAGTKFDQAGQDKAMMYLLRHKAGGGIKPGDSPETAVYKMAKEWASIPVPRGMKCRNGKISDGKTSYYGQRVAHSADELIAEIKAMGGTAAFLSNSAGANAVMQEQGKPKVSPKKAPQQGARATALEALDKNVKKYGDVPGAGIGEKMTRWAIENSDTAANLYASLNAPDAQTAREVSRGATGRGQVVPPSQRKRTGIDAYGAKPSSQQSLVLQGNEIAKRYGLLAGENKHLGNGRVGKHGKGSTHYTGDGFDVNAPGGIVEANSKRWKPIFDSAAMEYYRAGYNVLWNGRFYQGQSKKITSIPAGWGAHRDHMHVNIPRGGMSVTPSNGPAGPGGGVQYGFGPHGGAVGDTTATPTPPTPPGATATRPAFDAEMAGVLVGGTDPYSRMLDEFRQENFRKAQMAEKTQTPMPPQAGVGSDGGSGGGGSDQQMYLAIEDQALASMLMQGLTAR